MVTLTAIVALAGSVISANIPAQPQWQNDYREARQLALEAKKPLAVFIGSGASTGNFDPKVNQLLKDKYVCVYVDTTTAMGKDLAKEFAVDGKGLVISDKGGSLQAFHHSGDLSADVVEKALVRYADKEMVAGTESVMHLNAPPAPVRYQSTCPTCPNYVPSFAPSFGGCPGGNCR